MNGNRNFYEMFPVTSYLILVILAFFGLEYIAQTKLNDETHLWAFDSNVYRVLGSLYGPLVIDGGEYWRLISSVFLHAGLVHLFMNCMVLVDVGRMCEPLLSPWKFVVVYVASGVGGGVAHLLLAPRPAIGASGAICGLIGMLFAYATRHGKRALRDGLLRSVIFIAVISIALPFIAWAAHLGGFLVGCACGWTSQEYTTSVTAKRWRYPGYVVVAGSAVCLGIAVWNFFSATQQGT